MTRPATPDVPRKVPPPASPSTKPSPARCARASTLASVSETIFGHVWRGVRRGYEAVRREGGPPNACVRRWGVVGYLPRPSLSETVRTVAALYSAAIRAFESWSTAPAIAWPPATRSSASATTADFSCDVDR